MNRELLKYLKPAALALIGAVLGYSYWYYVGCNSGTCPITSNAWISAGYGLMLGLVLGMGRSAEKPTEAPTNEE